ncbi:gibberellin-regulated protein 1-like [Tripterygium wilfordii]|uniref:Gibberellin-regulated protein 1-like n=1 Tax=Tripterygium wilfordii TaxID=458696 RepID=A0A7J7DLD7_TRIWF|nr:gibberellin-regulated protein 1-like isoform X2 [Tripterygium wilfordii]KAF5747175.1 gibberellin-regulated protein 1-like [Tripterygium wilfordii]
MAMSKPLIASLLLISLLLLHLVEADHELGNAIYQAPAYPPTQKIDCDGACKGRCRLTKRKDLCKRLCGSCCGRCNCVPPGTSGNYDACYCYAHLTTPDGRRKCP